MKGKQTALMPGNGDKVGYWLTPPDLMKRLDDEFHFDFDACPYPRPAGFDGLKEDWGRHTYANPPFIGSSLSAWSKKCVAEHERGNTVVLIAPVDNWIGYLVKAGAEIRFVGPVTWYNPEGHARVSSRPNFLFILRPRDPSADGSTARAAREL